jgi:predicted O-methyltransferase YrrM
LGRIKRPPLRLSATSVKEGIRVLFENSDALYNYIFGGLSSAVERQCEVLIGKTETRIFWDNIQYNFGFRDYIANKLKDTNYGQLAVPELLYVLVRKLCPAVVVETGVAAGVSSAYILQAMEDNQHGHLYSIDLPNALPEEHHLPKGTSSGFVVPPYLRKRWTLLIGKTEHLLKVLLNRTGKVDMFVHDSEHSYQNMIFEYNAVWDYIKNGGLLVSHDINMNKAFRDFAKSHNKKFDEIYFAGIGIIRK